MGDQDQPRQEPPADAAPSIATAGPPSEAGKRRRRSGVLAHLPPIPEPVNVNVPGLNPKTAFFGWLILVLGILAVGVGLNWALTGGEWVPAGHDLANPDAAFADTPVQFVTADPFDIVTTSLFTLSIVILAISLVTPRPSGSRLGIFRPLAMGSGIFGALALASAILGPHLVAQLPRFAAAAEGTAFPIAGILFLALALAFLVIGLYRDALAAKRHEIRALGWIVFAGHWAMTGMYYYEIEGGDWVNMMFAYAAVFLLAYFAYQELVSRSLGEDNKSLRFTAAAVVFAASVWYAFLRVEFLAEFVIELVAVHTVWMLEMFNQNVVINEDGRTGFVSAISYPEAAFPRTVIIILACTAIQSMMIFVGAAFAVSGSGTGKDRTRIFNYNPSGTAKTIITLVAVLVAMLSYVLVSLAPISPLERIGAALFISLPVLALLGVAASGKPLSLMQRRILVVLVTVPIVYVLNLMRNTGIIIMWADRWLEMTMPGLIGFYASVTGGTASNAAFGIAHNWIGKGGSLLALVAIAFLVFAILPEVLRALVGLLDLPRRRGPLEQYYRALRGHTDQAKTAESPDLA